MSSDASIAARVGLRTGIIRRAFQGATRQGASPPVSGWKKLPEDEVEISGETGEFRLGADKAGLSPRLRALQDSLGLDDISGGEEKASQKAEEHEEEATVAVFDDFRNADEKGQFTHGELVEGRLQEQAGLGDEEVQRYQTDLGADFGAFEEKLARGDEGALENFIESSYTNSLDSTTGALEEVLDDRDSNVRTINQSQSQARGRLARDIWERTGEAPFREDLARSLGLESDVGDRELAEVLTAKINHTVSESDKIAGAKKRYDQPSEEAAEAGVGVHHEGQRRAVGNRGNVVGDGVLLTAEFSHLVSGSDDTWYVNPFLGIGFDHAGLGDVDLHDIAGIGADDRVLVQVIKAFAGGRADAFCTPFFLGHVDPL